MIKPFAWSFTSLEHSKQCLRSYHEIRVLKNFKHEQNEVSIWGDRVHKAFDAALKHGVPFLPEGMTLWEPVLVQFLQLKGQLQSEVELALTQGFQPCDWWAEDVWVRGIIDALWIDGPVAKAVDWKTGKRKPRSDQLALFALLIFHTYPEVQEVRTMFIWLKTLQNDKEVFKREEIPQLWQRFIPDLHRLKNAHDTNAWPPTTSGLCRAHCPVVTCSFNGNAHLNRGVT